MRLIHRKRERVDALEEREAYDHSYGGHVLRQVDVVPAPPPIEVDVVLQDEPSLHHVTTHRLKRQFEERLAARKRRNARGS